MGHSRLRVPHPSRCTAPLLLAAVLLANTGCLFPETVNKPLLTYEPAHGYRFDAVTPGPDNSDETFICLTLSGGGTRRLHWPTVSWKVCANCPHRVAGVRCWTKWT